MSMPLIPLMGDQPNFVNSLAQGARAAALTNQVTDDNALRSLYADQGAGIAAGDPNAMNALAQLDPMAANRMTIARNADRRAEERLGMARAAVARQLAAAEDQAEAQREAREAVDMGNKAMTALMSGDEQAWSMMTREFTGGTPLPMSREGAAMLQSIVLGTADFMAALPQRAERTTGMDTLHQRAMAAGLREGTPEYQQFMLNGGAQKKGMELTVGADGSVTLIEGGGAAQSSSLSPTAPEAMIATIDGILNDPALDYSTGILSPLQNVPGTPMRRVGSRVDQLNGQAFLQAFERLKGAGQITEIEGTKATQAIGRLDSAQSPEDYKQSLTELRSILVTASQRPQDWVNDQRRATAAQELIPASEIAGMTPEQIMALGPDALTRIPVSELNLSDEQWDALERLAQ